MIKQMLYFSSPVKLNIKNNQLRIVFNHDDNKNENAEICRPIEDIGIVVIDTPQIVLTSAVLSCLVANGIAILCCDNKHMPAGLMLNLNSNSVQAERFQTQLNVSIPLKKRLWQQTVSSKIYNQAIVLYRLSGKRHVTLTRYMNNVKSGDTDNIEGRAAAYYWKNIWSKDTNFKRSRDGEEPNSLLNYGYAILRAIVCRALVSSGLHLTLGIFHKNKYNPYCLADDIMEPYRPFVDYKVAEIFFSNPDASLEDKNIKRELMAIATEDVVIEGRKRPLMVGVSETTASLYRCYSGELRKIKYPVME